MANYNWTNYPKQNGGGAGDGGVTQLGTFDSMPSLPEGASISGDTLFMQGATALFPGLVSSASQTFAGVKTFLSPIVLDSLTANLPLQLDGSKATISAPINLQFQTVASISLEDQVRGNLPLSQTSGSISLVNQVRDLLPILQTSGSVSLEDKVVGLLPILQTSGSVSLEDKVTGFLPLAQTSGSISLEDRVSGFLPLTQTTGSISLVDRVSGLLPASMILGSVSASNIPPQSVGGDVSFVISNGSANAVLASSISGAKTFSTSLATPVLVATQANITQAVIASVSAGSVVTSQITIGSTTISNPGGAAVSWNLPTAQGSPNAFLQNQGSGSLVWTLVTPGSPNVPTSIKTANYTVQTTDGIVRGNATSGSFSFTLFSPVGVNGVEVTMQKVDTSLNVIQMVGSGLSEKYLSTFNDTVTVYSNNSAWVVKSRTYDATPVGYSPAWGGFGTVSANLGYWSRDGKYLDVNVTFVGGTVQSALGTVELPIGLQLDPNYITINNNQTTPGMFVGTIITVGGTNNQIPLVTCINTTSFLLFTGGGENRTNPLTPQNVDTNFLGGVTNSANFRVPILRWN